ncbi:MAG: hypothetical protein C5B50_01930 [Verrucomicrobia bacterium]|nr:MAG: hypothetical protein C5B50_01930 [Verrucomicrobiota bacterium]
MAISRLSRLLWLFGQGLEVAENAEVIPGLILELESYFEPAGFSCATRTGGDNAGQNLRSANYTNNSLNQITSRDVPGYLSVIGSANRNATVTIWSKEGPLFRPVGNLARPSRHGEYFAVESMPMGPARDAALQALQAGKVQGQIFKYP